MIDSHAYNVVRPTCQWLAIMLEVRRGMQDPQKKNKEIAFKDIALINNATRE